MKVVDVKQAIATLYEKAKMTQAEIAAELHCSQPSVSYYLSSGTRSPKAILVERIRAAFARRNLEVPMCDAPGGAA
jgi:predicted transcriptional regulator